MDQTNDNSAATDPATTDPADAAAPAVGSEAGGEGENAKGSMLDAIRAGVSEADGKPAAKPAEAPADPAQAGNDPAATAPPGERQRGPDGKFLPKDPAAAAAPAATATPAAGKPPAATDPNAPKQPDPVNDPIPDGTPPRTAERIQSLIGRVKERDQQFETLQTQFDGLVGSVADTGATPEQFNQSLDYLRAVNSGDPRQIEQALQIIEQERTALYHQLGRQIPAHDPLATHQDLNDAVQAGQITRELAQEIGRRRDAETFAQTRQQQLQTSQQDEQRQLVAARDAGNQLEATLRAVDPLYEQKKAVVLQTLNLAALPAAQRAAAFADAYAKVQLPAAAAPAPATAPAAAASPQPLRARQPAGGAQKQPSSMMEAIRAGIAQAGNR